MMRVADGPAATLGDASGLRFAVIVSRFNEAVTGALHAGAVEALTAARASAIDTFDVPGAFELPLGAGRGRRWKVRRRDLLGCVIRGETPHFEYISSVVAHAIADVGATPG